MSFSNDFQVFRDHFCDPDDDECMARVTHVLSFMMIRRTLKDKMFDRPIVELPDVHPLVQRVELSKVERFLYEALEEIFRRTVNQ